MFKYILLFSLAVVAIQALPKKCDENDKCDSGECCVDIIFVGKHCLKIPKRDAHCILGSKKEGDHYKMACPCEEGTECRMGKSLFDKLPKCRDPKSEEDDE